MAVYTPVSADDLTAFLAGYDVGAAVSFKGIAEGVENSNFLLETTRGRFILTLYEKRVDAGDLPWFLALMGHLAAKGLPVPGPVVDARGQVLQVLNGRRGPYIAVGKENYKIPKDKDAATLTLEECQALIAAQADAPKKKFFKKK
jgi:homoserine kinase type II